jgi:hypothetical protein
MRPITARLLPAAHFQPHLLIGQFRGHAALGRAVEVTFAGQKRLIIILAKRLSSRVQNAAIVETITVSGRTRGGAVAKGCLRTRAWAAG